MAIMSDKVKNAVRKLLLAFVLISIGFALGKEFTRRSMPQAATGGGIVAEAPAEQEDKVMVYYVHASYRCGTCNEIERLTKTLVDNEFTGEVANGRLAYRAFNFQQDEQLARELNIAAGCVVVAKIKSGEIVAHETLNGVWTLYSHPDRFNEYVSESIRKYLDTSRK